MMPSISPVNSPRPARTCAASPRMQLQLLAVLLLLCSLSVLLVPCEAQSGSACGGICAIKPEEGGCACDSSCKCPSERNPGQQPTSLPLANTSLAEPGQSCGPAANTKCSNKQCCSTSHYCGITTAHCLGANCLAGWGNCGPDFVKAGDAPAPQDSKPTPDAREAAPGGPCGPTNNAICPGGQCCSVYGFCGVQPDHCAPSNCTKGWGTCWGDKPTPTPGTEDTPTPGNEAVKQGMAPDRIAIIVCSVLGGVSAIVTVAYVVWKWRIKHRAVKTNSFFSSRRSSASSALPALHTPGSATGSYATSYGGEYHQAAEPHDILWPKVKSVALSSRPSSGLDTRLGLRDSAADQGGRRGGPSLV